MLDPNQLALAMLLQYFKFATVLVHVSLSLSASLIMAVLVSYNTLVE